MWPKLVKIDQEKVRTCIPSVNQQWSRMTSEDAGMIVLNLISSTALTTEDGWKQIIKANKQTNI